MKLSAGARLRSQVCPTEVIVILPGVDDVDLRCGGVPMVGLDVVAAYDDVPAAGLDQGAQLGKRYVTETAPVVEVLVTKAGSGTLSSGRTPLSLKVAKPLPASD